MISFKKLIPVFIFIGFLILVLLSRQALMDLLIENGITSYTTHMLLSTAVNILIVIVSILFIRKHKLQYLAGIGKTKLTRPLLLLFPFYIVLLNLVMLDEVPTENLLLNLFVLFVSCISIGISEELSLRGFLQSYIIKYFGNSKRSIILAVIAAALIFGVIHLIKFDKGAYGELAQVFYATFIGVMFGMLLLVTKRLAPLIIVHAIIDFVAKLDTMGIPNYIEGSGQTSSAMDAMITALVILPCFVYGMIISRRITTGTVISLKTN
ncbi:MAG: membrane protease YdiL (CAAX protease family) [Flavobacteriales bacterium]|jgi:membrane protease YdiL (CAAX protease family)